MQDPIGQLPYLCSQLVHVVYEVEGCGSQCQIANLEEIGEEGAVILADRPAAPGTTMRILCGEHELSGIVDRVTADPVLGNFVHVRLDAHCRWSPAWFTPEHLLALFRQVEEDGGTPQQGRAA